LKNLELCCNSEHQYFNEPKNEVEIKRAIIEVGKDTLQWEKIGTQNFDSTFEAKMSQRLSNFGAYRDVKVTLTSTKWK
jgi:hypothetical protein